MATETVSEMRYWPSDTKKDEQEIGGIGRHQYRRIRETSREGSCEGRADSSETFIVLDPGFASAHRGTGSAHYNLVDYNQAGDFGFQAFNAQQKSIARVYLEILPKQESPTKMLRCP